jgi:hypothetical protein
VLDQRLESHGIPVEALRADDFHGFIEARQRALLKLISRTTGQDFKVEAQPADEGEELPTNLAQDTGLELTEAD